MMSRRQALAAFVAFSVLVAFAFGTVSFLRNRGAREQAPAVTKLSPSPVRQSKATGRPNGYNRVVVIVVGINRYPNLTGEESNLECAEPDAGALADLFESRFGYETKRLIGTDATKREIEFTVKRTADELGPDDALIFFFAGHGQVIELRGAGEAGFLVPHEAALDLQVTSRESEWREQAINVHELFARASESKARHVLFILDACKSGIATGRGGSDLRIEQCAFLVEKSRAVLTAVRRHEKAREDLTRGLGHFTAALLDRLKMDESASTFDLYKHASEQVWTTSNRSMLPQYGQIVGDGMVVFIPLSVPREKLERHLQSLPDSPLAGVQGRLAEARKQLTTLDEVVEAFQALDYRPSPDSEDQAKKWEAKFERFKRNAGLDNGPAMAALTFCYAKGLGTRPDPKLAYEWAKQADRLSRPPGLGRWVLGLCQQHGIGVDAKNPAAAEELFRASVAANFSPGKLALARLLLERSEANLHQIEQLLTAAHADGLLDAGPALADLLLVEKAPGETSKQDALKRRNAVVPAAEKLYREAAALGHPRGELGLFVLYADGRPGYPNRDATKAEGHLRKAAAAGLPEALHHLGVAYDADQDRRLLLELNGDPVLAREFFDRAARMNYAPALFHSALMLFEGRGGGADEKLARERLEAAVRLDYARAYYHKAARMGKNAVLLAKDDEAFKLLELAATKGDPEACLLVGIIYWSGFGEDRELSNKGQYNHANTHTGAHWVMRALILDDEKRIRSVQYRASLILQKLVNEPKGVLLPRTMGIDVLSNSQVLKSWKKAQPDSFRLFCERFDVRTDSK